MADAVAAVPRHLFVPPALAGEAYGDHALPIGHGQTITQAANVARSAELAALSPGSRVLEIGTGSGYQAAVLAHLVRWVFTLERIAELAKGAQTPSGARDATSREGLRRLLRLERARAYDAMSRAAAPSAGAARRPADADGATVAWGAPGGSASRRQKLLNGRVRTDAGESPTSRPSGACPRRRSRLGKQRDVASPAAASVRAPLPRGGPRQESATGRSPRGRPGAAADGRRGESRRRPRGGRGEGPQHARPAGALAEGSRFARVDRVEVEPLASLPADASWDVDF